MAEVYVVIVTHNSSKDLFTCLNSFSSIKEDFKIVIVDNCSSELSTANSIESICEQINTIPWARAAILGNSIECNKYSECNILLHFSNNNLGFSGGNNLGAKIALCDKECKFLWFLNPDTYVLEDSLRELVNDISADESLGVCGSSLLDWPADHIFQKIPDEAIFQGSIVTFNIRTTISNQIGSGRIAKDAILVPFPQGELFYAIGASMMMTAKTYIDLNGFDEDYFLYFEEMDLVSRLNNLDKKVGWSRRSYVYHREGASAGTSRLHYASVFSCYHMSRSIILYYRKHHAVYLSSAVARCVLNAVRELIFRKRASATKSILIGMFHGFKLKLAL